ncbi:Amino acid transporter AVT1A-like protein [Drosera capensis]
MYTYALLMNPLARSLEELLPKRIAETYWTFILLRTGLVVSTVCVAFLVPFFGLMMALAGSLVCMLASTIMPPLCFLKLTSQPSKLQVILCYTVAALGGVVAVLGTYSSVYDIIKSL